MTQALTTLLDHAERERDEALARLLQAQEHARRLQQQAEQLETYRDEYRSRHPALGGRAASIDLVRCHQQFMHRLDLALAHQQLQIEQSTARAAALRAELLALETRVASVRKLVERRDLEARRLAERQEQRASDEAAQRGSAGALGWRAAVGGGGGADVAAAFSPFSPWSPS